MTPQSPHLRPFDITDHDFIVRHMRAEDMVEIEALLGPLSVHDLNTYAMHSNGAAGAIIHGIWYHGYEPVIYFSLTNHWAPRRACGAMYATDKFKLVGAQFRRWARNEAIPLFREFGLRRIEVRAMEHNVPWIISLGGKVEATLDRFGLRGETFHQCALELHDTEGLH